ncbi:MAG: endonuclease domain-containing protein [Roseitalea porphyridii]|uniref:endonuclease domain-containing protein n=1 Tax=Roseitalea porphyridii TaxID=1852022 RepID=UPI0032EFC594
MAGSDEKEKLAFARAMRADPTPAENRLWQVLRGRRLGGLKFKRQEPMGPYIVDFVCHDKRLIVEVDGGQHSESAQDRIRDGHLESSGYRVLRFWNDEVMQNPDGVAGHILAVASAR